MTFLMQRTKKLLTLHCNMVSFPSNLVRRTKSLKGDDYVRENDRRYTGEYEASV